MHPCISVIFSLEMKELKLEPFSYSHFPSNMNIALFYAGENNNSPFSFNLMSLWMSSLLRDTSCVTGAGVEHHPQNDLMKKKNVSVLRACVNFVLWFVFYFYILLNIEIPKGSVRLHFFLAKI